MLSIFILLSLLLILFIQIYTYKNRERFEENKIISYCINLSDNKNRWNDIMNQQKNLSFNIQRIDAIDTRGNKWMEYSNMLSPEAKIKLENTIKNGVRLEHEDLTPGAIGCFLSHLKVYQKILNDGDDKYFLVLEDDNIFIRDFDIKIKDVFKNVPEDWDIILLDHRVRKSDDINPIKVRQFFLMNCYIINKKGIQKILSNHKSIYNQIDSFLSDLASKDLINIYSISPKLARQSKSGTNIQTYNVM